MVTFKSLDNQGLLTASASAAVPVPAAGAAASSAPPALGDISTKAQVTEAPAMEFFGVYSPWARRGEPAPCFVLLLGSFLTDQVSALLKTTPSPKARVLALNCITGWQFCYFLISASVTKGTSKQQSFYSKVGGRGVPPRPRCRETCAGAASSREQAAETQEPAQLLQLPLFLKITALLMMHKVLQHQGVSPTRYRPSRRWTWLGQRHSCPATEAGWGTSFTPTLLPHALGSLFVLPDVKRVVGRNIRPCLEVTSPITFNYYRCKIEGDFYSIKLLPSADGQGGRPRCVRSARDAGSRSLSLSRAPGQGAMLQPHGARGRTTLWGESPCGEACPGAAAWHGAVEARRVFGIPPRHGRDTARTEEPALGHQIAGCCCSPEPPSLAGAASRAGAGMGTSTAPPGLGTGWRHQVLPQPPRTDPQVLQAGAQHEPCSPPALPLTQKMQWEKAGEASRCSHASVLCVPKRVTHRGGDKACSRTWASRSWRSPSTPESPAELSPGWQEASPAPMSRHSQGWVKHWHLPGRVSAAGRPLPRGAVSFAVCQHPAERRRGLLLLQTPSPSPGLLHRGIALHKLCLLINEFEFIINLMVPNWYIWKKANYLTLSAMILKQMFEYIKLCCEVRNCRYNYNLHLYGCS